MRTIALVFPSSTLHQENTMNRLAIAVFGLGVMFVNQAHAADPLPSTCGTSGTDLCVDVDGDGHFANATATEAQDCQDDKAWVFPGARPTLRDGVDSDCDGTDDDAEEEAAIEAARQAAAKKADASYDPASGTMSPKAEAAADLAEEQATIVWDRCSEGGWWANEEAMGMFGWSSATAPAKPTCFGFDENEFSWDGGVHGDGYRSRADRRALGLASRAQASAAALAEQLGHPAIAAAPATATTPAVEAVPATGLYARLAEVEGAMRAADAETKRQLAAQKAELERQIGENKSALVALKGRVSALEANDARQDARITALEKDGALFLVKPGFGLVFGETLYEADDTTVVRAGSGVVGTVAVAGGIAWGGHHLLAAEINGGQGKRGDLPYSLGTGAVGYTYRFDGGFTLGGRGVVMAGATGNPLDSDVSGWGLGGGPSVGYLAELPNRNLLGVEGVVDVVGSNYGTNHDYYTGPETMVGVRLVVGGIR